MKNKIFYVFLCIILIISIFLILKLKNGNLNYTFKIEDESNDVIVKSIETYVNGNFNKTHYKIGNNIPNKFEETTIKGKHETIFTLSIPSYNIDEFKVIFTNFNENEKMNYKKEDRKSVV